MSNEFPNEITKSRGDGTESLLEEARGLAHRFFNLRPCEDDHLLLPILDLAEKYEVATEIDLAPYFLLDNLYLVHIVAQRNLNIIFSTDASRPPATCFL